MVTPAQLPPLVRQSTQRITAQKTDPQSKARAHRKIPVKDASTRTFLFAQLIGALDTPGRTNIQEIRDLGLPPEVVEKLRLLSMADAMRFGGALTALSIHVDCVALAQQLEHLEAVKRDRARFEAFVVRGASPTLLTRLFGGTTEQDVRNVRRQLAPHSTIGGRPRMPAEAERLDIQCAWRQICASGENERNRYWQLAERFEAYPLVSLEAVIGSQR